MKTKFICAVVLALLLTGCGNFFSDWGQYSDMYATEREWRQRNIELNKMLSGPTDIQGENLLKVIIDGINQKDVSIVKSVFSEKTRNNVLNLDAQILDMFTYIDGNISDYKFSGGYAESEHTPMYSYGDKGAWTGDMYWCVCYNYDIKVGEKSYAINFAFYSSCLESPERNGIFLLEIMPETLANTIGFQHSITEQGIFLG